MYKCMECGHLFEEGEQKTWKEDRGEYWGSPCYEEISGCPLCGEAYEVAVACKKCGGYGYMGEGREYCNVCKASILKRLKTEFSKVEIDLIYKLCEDELI